MKNVILTVLLALATAPAFATDATVSVEAASDYLYRGQSVTADKPAITADLRLDDLVVDGLFVTASGTTIDVGNLDETGSVRTDLAVGYGRNFGGLDVSASVARVINPVLYSDDYTEVRVDAAYPLTANLSVTGQVAQILTDSVGQDRYASVGLAYSDFLTEGLTVGGLVSVADYDFADTAEFNNAEVFATYAVAQNLEVFGTYSWGGESVENLFDATDITFNASALKNQGLVGVRYTF